MEEAERDTLFELFENEGFEVFEREAVFLRWGGAAESLVWPEIRVEEKAEAKPLFELPLNERLEGFERQHVFERSPESLDEGDGADFPDGAEAMQDAELFDAVEKLLRDELASLVGDEVTRNSEALDVNLEKPEDGLRCRFL